MEGLGARFVSEEIGIVGGGILGLAIARQLLASRPDSRVTVIEKEPDVARHQTSHNSGVAHAGLYYKPGTLKATLCRRGIGLLKDFCQQHRLPYVECGKLVVAVDESEVAPLRALYERAQSNGVPGLRLLDQGGIRELEPHAAGVLAVHSPSTAIVDFAAVARVMADEIRAAGGEVRCGFAVNSIREDAKVVVSSPDGELRFDRVIVCAGLHADRVARMAGHDAEPRVIPFRGEYYRMTAATAPLIKGLIYPVPNPRLPFLGVHFTRRVDGSVDVGPNAVLALSREGYRWRDVSMRDLADTATWPGFWRVARKHWRVAIAEVLGSLSKDRYMALARRYVPCVSSVDVVPAPAGVRAQAVDRQGHLVDDFVITRRGNIVAIRNAPSPAATSSLAIAEHVYRELFGLS